VRRKAKPRRSRQRSPIVPLPLTMNNDQCPMINAQ
jgi:hypothetical protein